MKTLICVVALASCIISFGNPPLDEGKTIFTSRCAGCHNVNKTLTGPALAGVDQRRSLEWIISFVHSSQSLIKKGDRDAVALFEQFNKIPMPDHADLSADNIKSIVEYIKSEATSTTVEAAPFSKPAKLHPAYSPQSLYTYFFFITFIALVLVLIAVLVAFVKVKSIQRSLRREE